MSQARLFISYSHKDEDWLELVRTHLALLQQQGLIFAWSDKNIRPGDAWQEEIETAIAEAEVAVLLVSPNFLASEFIMREELPRLMAIKNGEQPGRLRRIMPLILEPCLWNQVPALKLLEVRPKGRELSAGGEHQQNADLAEFAAYISQILFQPEEPREVEGARASSRPVVVAEKGYATLEMRLSHCEWNNYGAELNFTWSGDRTFDFVRRYRVCLDLARFAEIKDPITYAQELRNTVFPNEDAWEDVVIAKRHAVEKKVPLRLRICIEPSARELHTLSWEKLTLGHEVDNPLSPRSTALARYALGYGLSSRAALSRRADEPRALLIAIARNKAAHVNNTPVSGLDPIANLLSEAGISCTVVSDWREPGDLDELLRENNGIDYIYLLVKDGTDSENRVMSCPLAYQNFDDVDQVRSELAHALDSMARPPRLMMIVPEAADHVIEEQNWPWLVQLAHESIERGVLCVLTLQDVINDKEWQGFLQVFFGEIIQHGQVDLAARSACEYLSDAAAPWAPVVISRLRSARLWYVPRLMDETRRDDTWQLLVSRVANGRCTPIIGPGIDYRIARSRDKIAHDWADRYQYPLALHEYVSLPQVAQYVAATRGDARMEEDFHKDLSNFALERYGYLLDDAEKSLPLDKMLSAIADKILLKEPGDPHVILSSLPFPTYITANFNNFLADALRKFDRKPQEFLFNSEVTPTGLDAPDPNQPLVYHLFGRVSDTESLVLTEDDYFDFLIEFWRDRERVPGVVRRALASSSLLFLGFNLNDWDFRVLFRSLMQEQSSQRRRKQLHVAVQVDPDDDQIADPDRAREYLEKYFEGFSESEVSIYWGSCEDFLSELNRRWQAHRS